MLQVPASRARKSTDSILTLETFVRGNNVGFPCSIQPLVISFVRAIRRKVAITCGDDYLKRINAGLRPLQTSAPP